MEFPYLRSLLYETKSKFMKEDFLHYIWRTRQFDHTNLKTSEGQSISIIQTGIHNHDAGPDFSDARIRIEDMLWAGNVEIHIKASEWYQHQHHQDSAYNNVILHVVLEEDKRVLRANGRSVPCLELKKRIPFRIIQNYRKLKSGNLWIPCQNQISRVSSISKNLWLDRLLVERLENKTRDMIALLKKNNYDWEYSFYYFLARGFGLKVNAEPFEQLARSLPLNILARHRNSLFQLEALLFGQAGMLEKTFVDEYPQRLRKEYGFLKKKYQLQPINAGCWKFLRMRPANFPSIRIAQFAMLIYQSNHLFSKTLAAKNIKELENMFEVKISNYWQTHYLFDKPSIKRNKTLGKMSIDLLIINIIVPFLFLYGKLKVNPKVQESALDLLDSIKPERNAIIDQWKKLGFYPISAYQTQALIQLKNYYCDKKKCLSCSIGHEILRA